MAKKKCKQIVVVKTEFTDISSGRGQSTTAVFPAIKNAIGYLNALHESMKGERDRPAVQVSIQF